MKIGKRTILLLLSLLLALGTCIVPCSAEESDNAVRVGYLDYNGFIEQDDEGNFSGYGVEYLNEIAVYTGYRYEYVYGQWTELMEKLKNKEIDFLCTAQYSRERAEIYDYTSYPIGYTQGLVYTLADGDICYEDFLSFDGMTVGALRGSAMNAIFDEYAANNGFSYTLKEYDTEGLLLDALNKGEVTAICSEHLANHTNLSLIANFGADAYYLMSYKGSPYVYEVNFALQQIKTNADFETDLYHKYYDSSAAESMVQFTSEEKQLIASGKIFTVGLMPNRSPLSCIDENGEPAGMMVDLMKIVAEKSGLKFEYKFIGIGQTGYDFMTSGGGDLVVGVASSAFSTPNPNLLQSDTIQSGSIVFVGRKGMDFSASASLTVAVPAGFINGDRIIAEKYPSFKCYNGTNNQSCLDAIRDGQADVMLQNMYIIRECLQSPLYDDLAIFPAYSFPEDEKIVTMPENTVLISVINKAIAEMTYEQENNVVISNTIAKSYHASIGEIVYKFRLPLIGIAALLIIVIGMMLAIAIIRNHSYRAVEKVNEQLEKSNEQMAEAVVQADRASTAKSQFLSRMSHEIRTPMNAIVGLTTIAKRHEDDAAKIDDYLGKIETSSKVLLNIINDVLDMSAIESNKLKIANEEFDIKQILTGISTIYYPQCESKGIKFVMATDLECEIFKGDSLRVSQILLNLMSNAYKFTEKGGAISFNVKEKARRDNTAFVRFVVSDTGAGMTKDMQERLFKPFEQETASTAQKHGGSGLGLSIAKNLVDMMHGAIKVESEKGKGTTFTVDIPFEAEPKANVLSNESIKKIRVLVVDDDATSLEYASIVLKRIGAPFETAASGKKALEMIDSADAQNKPYNVVMIDWKMPDMDGVELTRRIRENEKNGPMIIIVSAYDLNMVEDEAKSVGADHFVSKPLFQSTVFNVLMTLTDGQLRNESKSTASFDFTGHKVLLAEDNELNSEIAIDLLDMVNMSADRAENGHIAVDMFKNAAPDTYDAILMDVQMPEMDGYEATRAIRALARADAKKIPIYAMTANAFTEDVSQALSAGMNGHIAKPINTEILYKVLQKVVDEKR